MELNWTPEVFVEIALSILILIALLVIYVVPKTKKIKSLFFFRLSFIFMALFFLLDAISILFLDTIVGWFSFINIFPSTVLLTIAINYILKESYNSIILILIVSYGLLAIFFSLLPDAIVVEYESGRLTVNWHGLFLIFGDIYTIIPLVLFIYWGVKTWINAPFLIKREATLFFIGILIASPLNFLFYLYFSFNPIYGIQSHLISDIIGTIGIFIFCLAVVKEPKLVYLLPFKIYRIVVKDRKGYPLFDHDWSRSNISEEIFTGFINAVQVMSEEVMNIGGLLDINLQKGILILHESELITVGLVSSKSSQLLKDSIVNFTSDFEDLFEKQLKEFCIEQEKYELAYLLIDKHFSNFPSRIIPSKRHPILLSGEFVDIPLELENRIKSIVSDKDELNVIKSEILKAPYGLSDEFLSLYDELKEEIKRIEGGESKYLDSELNEDK
jgi:hypothetical protein